MRTINDHKVNGDNDRLTITAHVGRHEYDITSDGGMAKPTHLRFHKLNHDTFRPSHEYNAGVNGITHEALLAILADRLRGFQDEPYACRENAKALAHIEGAQQVLQQRTVERMQRGVEGTHTV